MRHHTLVLSGAVLALAAVTHVGAAAAAPAIRNWTVLGPIPGQAVKTPGKDGVTRSGFHTDYLRSLGGESKARLQPNRKVIINGQTLTTRQVRSDAQGVVRLSDLFGELTNSTAYAYTEWTVSRPTRQLVAFGSDDWAKVWLNGELVHSVWQGEGRGLEPMSETLTLPLVKGVNRLLVKVDQNSGPWALSLVPTTPREVAARRAAEAKRNALNDALNARVGWPYAYTFAPGAFPRLGWEKPELMERAFGKADVSVKWYNASGAPVIHADKPGRYMAVLEARTRSGRVVRRGITCCCLPSDFQPWWTTYEVDAPAIIAGAPVNPEVWNGYQSYLRRNFGSYVLDSLFEKEQGAILMAGLMEAEPLSREVSQLDWPQTRHQDAWLALRLKQEGKLGKYPGLKAPQRRQQPAQTLAPGSCEQAGVDPSTPQHVRSACNAWWEATRMPFTVTLARNGVVFFREAFGQTPSGKPVDVDARMPLASLTKLHAGLLFGMCMDQGLLNWDDPVGKYLPGFPVKGDKAITLRHCLTHTSGLDGHGNYGGMLNPYLDQVIADGLELTNPGRVVLYNGMGFDLAGKVMEVVGQRSIFRLFHDALFTPLGHQGTVIVDLGYGIECSSLELARVGQLLLNEGSYGDLQFMRPETFRKITPRRVKDALPQIPDPNWIYGAGISYMVDTPLDAKPDANGVVPCLFSRKTLGHGAATGAVLRADPEHRLVISICRNQPGPDYGTHLTRVLQAVADGLPKAP